MYFLLTVIIISWFEHPPQLPQFPLQEPPPQPPCLCSRMMLLTQSTTTRSKIIPTITFPIASSYIRITEQLLIRTQGIYPAVIARRATSCIQHYASAPKNPDLRMHNSQFFAYASMHPKGKYPGLQAGPAIISHLFATMYCPCGFNA